MFWIEESIIVPVFFSYKLSHLTHFTIIQTCSNFRLSLRDVLQACHRTRTVNSPVLSARLTIRLHSNSLRKVPNSNPKKCLVKPFPRTKLFLKNSLLSSMSSYRVLPYKYSGCVRYFIGSGVTFLKSILSRFVPCEAVHVHRP